MTSKPTVTLHSEAELVADLVAELRSQLQVVADRRAELAEGGFDPDLSAAAASLGRVLVAAVAERRQQAKAAVREVSKIPLDTIVSYLKGLNATQKASVVAELTGADAEEPLL